ncbi:helix-turn-helix domain-containing protein [Streptomyces sp. NPDC087219]|uniref:helix-turn-helix domain-containing protein n=1 Tax=unclassified Streptomyces TaxID=2593676 RepID=UPI0037F91BAA
MRTLTRRFRAEVGMSPGQWRILRRVDLARHLRETADRPVDVVAERAGFGTGVSPRTHLHAVLRTTPQACRRTFRPTPVTT